MRVRHMSVHDPGFQDANYFAQGGDAASRAPCVQLPARFVGDGSPSGNRVPPHFRISRSQLEIKSLP